MFHMLSILPFEMFIFIVYQDFSCNYPPKTIRSVSISLSLVDVSSVCVCVCVCVRVIRFFYRAMHFSAKRGIAIACRLCLSVCLSVCDVGELWSHRLEFFKNNFTIS